MPKVNVKDARRQQLMEANVSSIAKRGLAETTITHVSQGAGMSRGIVNFYFTSKENMMLQTLKYLVGEYDALCQEAAASTKAHAPIKRLEALASAHFSSKLCSPRRLTVWAAFWGHASTHNDYRKLIAAGDERCKKLAREIVTALGQGEMEAKLFAEEMHALIRGQWLTFMLANDSPTRQKLEANCHAFIQRWFLEPVITKPRLKEPTKHTVNARKVEVKKPNAQPALGDLFASKG